jgi:hypothetical protein
MVEDARRVFVTAGRAPRMDRDGQRAQWASGARNPDDRHRADDDELERGLVVRAQNRSTRVKSAPDLEWASGAHGSAIGLLAGQPQDEDPLSNIAPIASSSSVRSARTLSPARRSWAAPHQLAPTVRGRTWSLCVLVLNGETRESAPASGGEGGDIRRRRPLAAPRRPPLLALSSETPPLDAQRELRSEA